MLSESLAVWRDPHRAVALRRRTAARAGTATARSPAAKVGPKPLRRKAPCAAACSVL